MVSTVDDSKEKVFMAKQEIQRTFYSPRRQQQNHQPTKPQDTTGKYVYGSPNRGNKNILNFHEDGLLSKFGTGGGGAPNRDQYGNIVA